MFGCYLLYHHHLSLTVFDWCRAPDNIHHIHTRTDPSHHTESHNPLSYTRISCCPSSSARRLRHLLSVGASGAAPPSRPPCRPPPALSGTHLCELVLGRVGAVAGRRLPLAVAPLVLFSQLLHALRAAGGADRRRRTRARRRTLADRRENRGQRGPTHEATGRRRQTSETTELCSS